MWLSPFLWNYLKPNNTDTDQTGLLMSINSIIACESHVQIALSQ